MNHFELTCEVWMYKEELFFSTLYTEEDIGFVLQHMDRVLYESKTTEMTENKFIDPRVGYKMLQILLKGAIWKTDINHLLAKNTQVEEICLGLYCINGYHLNETSEKRLNLMIKRFDLTKKRIINTFYQAYHWVRSIKRAHNAVPVEFDLSGIERMKNFALISSNYPYKTKCRFTTFWGEYQIQIATIYIIHVLLKTKTISKEEAKKLNPIILFDMLQELFQHPFYALSIENLRLVSSPISFIDVKPWCELVVEKNYSECDLNVKYLIKDYQLTHKKIIATYKKAFDRVNDFETHKKLPCPVQLLRFFSVTLLNVFENFVEALGKKVPVAEEYQQVVDDTFGFEFYQLRQTLNRWITVDEIDTAKFDLQKIASWLSEIFFEKKALGQRLFADQTGELADYFHLTHVPAVVKENVEKKQWQVQEIKID